MLVPQVPVGYSSGPQNLPFATAHGYPVPNYPAAANNLPSASAHASFRALAHKHAHHLHSIPPREKSTRTLIIDHMLWVHGRTRFAQARAELGMTDRTGGPSSSHYAHRCRPETYEEEDEEGSEGEDVIKLKARSGEPDHPPGDDEEDRLRTQDLTLARNLRLRAEGLEKVVTSMLEQPPPIHPVSGEDIWTPPTSPKMNPSNQRDPLHPHTLPNGVRLRLALGTIINDLFARQAPPPPYRHQFQLPNSKTATPSGHSPTASYANASNAGLPLALASLSTVCALHSSSSPSFPPGKLPGSSFPSYAPQADRNVAPHMTPPTSGPRTYSFYMAGADPSTANSPPSFRCPRHLHTGCEICVEAKVGGRPNVGGARGRSSSSSHGGAGQANSWKGMPGGVGPGGGGVTGWQDGSGIGSGLLRPGVHGSVLRRKVNENDASEDGTSSTGAGNAKLSELIPRFIRLSALVAAELGVEAGDEEGDSSSMNSRGSGVDRTSGNDGGWDNVHARQDYQGDYSSLPSPASPPSTRATSQAQDRAYEAALRPTREWYMLLAGLLTRAVLEGYLTAGWRGSQAVECLLTVGLGLAKDAEKADREESGFEEFDPDGLPSLLDAVKVLFPMAKTVAPIRKGQAEEEYEIEMYERLRKFYDIPASTPDLSTHMEDLAWQYPAEPVERAAVRFCEAIAKWRGKPELETYKKKTASTYGDAAPGGESLTIESLVHSNPTTPTTDNAVPSIYSRRYKRIPSIDTYFTPPFFHENLWNQNKRTRPNDGGRASAPKRAHG